MIKLTSDLDFKLTKKRFVMMGRRFSRTRVRLALSVLLPALLITTFVFCTKTDSNDYWFPEYRLMFSNMKPPLYRKGSDQLIYSEVNGEREVYTGTSKTFDWQTNLIKFEHIVKNGYLLESSTFDSTGSLSTKTFYASTDFDEGYAKIGRALETLYFNSEDSLVRRTIHTYTGPEEKFAELGSPKARHTFSSDGTLVQKFVYTYPKPHFSETKVYDIVNDAEVLTYEFSYFSGKDTSSNIHNGYFENGDLQFHSTITRYPSGTIETKTTEWDETGNIVRYEHKVNGEIVEEINNGEEG